MNRDPIFFSIVIPTYNHAHYLRRALKSVERQSFTNWEIIIVDNNSTDDTLAVIKQLRNQNIKLVQISNKGIIAKSRNAGIKIAKGKWIAFLDSDDFWQSKKLEICFNSIHKNPSLDVIITNELQVDESSGIKKSLIYGPFSSNFYYKLLVYGNCLSPSASVVKKDFLYKRKILFRENRKYISAEDYDFWMLLARAGAKFKFINSIQGVYTIHQNNISKKIELHNSNILSVIKDHVFNLQNFDHDKLALWSRIKFRFSVEDFIKNLCSGNFSYCFEKVVDKKNFSVIFRISFLLSILVFKLKLYFFNFYCRICNCFYPD